MRYPKGVSGNPKGPPPGNFSLLRYLKKKLKEVPNDQKETNAEIAMNQYIKLMKEGKPEILKDALDRFDGKPKQSEGDLGSKENPVNHVHKVKWE